MTDPRPAPDRLSTLTRAVRALDKADTTTARAAAARALAEVLGEAPALAADLSADAARADQAVRKDLAVLESDLREACRLRSWRLDGAWPEFWIETAVPVVIDERKTVVRVDGQGVAPAARAVVAALQPIVAGLLPRKADVAGLRRALAAAIDAASAGPQGAPAPEVYRRMVIDGQSKRFWSNATVEAFTPLSLSQFRARFALALDGGATFEDGRALRMSPPLRAEDGLYLWQPAERRFGWVGWLRFETRP